MVGVLSLDRSVGGSYDSDEPSSEDLDKKLLEYLDDEGPPTARLSNAPPGFFLDEEEEITITTSIEKLIGVQDKVVDKLNKICELLETPHELSR